MSKVVVVTDSTATIPTDLLMRYSIFTIPLQVVWGEETFRDGVDIQPSEFYERLKTAKVMPTTSQPSPQAFVDVYNRLIDEGHDIISIHISAKLSGTVDSALQAKAMLKAENIEIIDSETTSMAMGYQVIEVAKAARKGASLQKCKELAESLVKSSGVFFVVETLEFLHRGGRIGGASAFLGTMLDLKPVLKLQDGAIEAVERVRNMNKAIDRMLLLLEKDLNECEMPQLATLHSNNPELAEQLLKRACQRFGADESCTYVTDISPVLGTHTGPGCVGIAYLKN
jgi:DegV family protein with EDD domain